MMVCLGALSQGSLPGGAAVFSLAPLGVEWTLGGEELAQQPEDDGNEAARAVVQPNFEVLVPASGEASYGWDLQKIADFVQSGPMRQYRITRGSVYRALQSGWDGPRILGFLARISAYPVPGGVERTVQGWCSEYGRIEIQTLCVVSCADEDLARELRRFAPLSSRTVDAGLGERFLAFSPHDQEQIAGLLRQLGHLVRSEPPRESLQLKV